MYVQQACDVRVFVQGKKKKEKKTAAGGGGGGAEGEEGRGVGVRVGSTHHTQKKNVILHPKH